jgi:hypothetical protein
VQVLTKNVQILSHVVRVVPAALVTEAVAARGETVNFAAMNGADYWAYRVVPDNEITGDMQVHKVPTYSLSHLQVRFPVPSI